MSFANSHQIITNQQGIHEHLVDVVEKHLKHPFQKPYQSHSLEGFKLVAAEVEKQGKPIIFDSCCGVGDSTVNLAKLYPEHFVIGMDKSGHRLNKNEAYEQHGVDNFMLLRTDLNDFWRLALEAEMLPEKHFILYPNPWPKSKHLQRRWHGAAVFPALVALGGELEMRSNWRLYLDEFAAALAVVNKQASVHEFNPQPTITPFERKYQASGQALYQLKAAL
ncbi:tRNA (guanosine(46)-N(7))-methyltransferase TrmB [Psychrobium sp. 1_MG-2023]|uniref:tRNA (guanine(46)-N(7))-methyltransferase TrmB n=1 Tax=Psychrobium sp. 1_MG-2023 TaxID=3062624 RepID=UPI000C324174|nr:SAM-dependent methyltransferase [Psychrobium sp. 1_MG-2023]MDP2561481.1 SAM-dependent methyltransferase [Psychrobium sp. 1_MG-2023]PKF57747.1 SAM-dependent methyltransferase [Alteromonadales bacterium alter-6D02]